MLSNRGILVLALAAVTVYAGLRYVQAQRPTRVPAHTFTTDVNQALLFLKRNTKADIFKSLDSNSQDLMLTLVREHCSRKFEEQSCLHYAISCGRPCMAYLTKPERLRLLTSFERIHAVSKGEL